MIVVNRARADENWSPLLVNAFNFVGNSSVLGASGFVDHVSLVVTYDWDVGWDNDNFNVIDFAKFLGFGGSGTSHAGELFVESEVILDRNGC